jgi:hypothetical protein
MYRMPVWTLSFVTALSLGASAQELKHAAILPHMEDVKTAPHVDSKETGPASQPSTRVEDAAASVRGERVRAAAGPIRPTPEYPLFDVDETGTQWVRGATYKASFGPAGATYIPFLGSRAPRNYPVTMRVAGITAAGAAVEYDLGANALRDGTTISFDRGSVVEEYRIERDGMEQRFVFDALPARGEIVVTLDVETELSARADADGLRFENALGHMRYGRAIALDAAGRSAAVEERLDNGRIRLVVPASFVATAELPLVIDPFQGTFVVDQDGNDDYNADVAFVTGIPAALVVYEYAFSAADHDIYSEKYIDQIYQGMALVDISIDDWRGPRVAGNELSGRFLCVAEVGTPGNRIIRGRTITATTLALGTVMTYSGTETGEKHAPDVGGDPVLTGPTYFYVVWQREYSATDTDIHARLVSSTGVPQGSSVIFLENSGSTLDSRPSISKTDGNAPFSTQNWTVVWQHEASSTDDDVQGARIRWDGTITSPTFTVAGTAANERFPTASEPLDLIGSQPRRWLSVYTLDSDLRFRAWEDTSVADTMDLAAGLFTTLSAPDVTTDGRLWQIAYTSRSNTLPNTDVDVRAASVSIAGGSLSFAEASVAIASSSTDDEQRPRIASTIGSGNPYRSYIAYDANRATTGLDVLVGVYDSPINAGGYAYCFGTAATCPCSNGGSGTAGCASSVNPNGATLTASGYWLVTADTAVLTASGMPSTASALYFQGTSQNLNGAIFGDGLRCATGTIVRLATKTSVNGASQYPSGLNLLIHLKGAVPAAGGWRYYQVWYRNSAAFCSPSTFNLTNGVARLWAP